MIFLYDDILLASRLLNISDVGKEDQKDSFFFLDLALSPALSIINFTSVIQFLIDRGERRFYLLE